MKTKSTEKNRLKRIGLLVDTNTHARIKRRAKEQGITLKDMGRQIALKAIASHDKNPSKSNGKAAGKALQTGTARTPTPESIVSLLPYSEDKFDQLIEFKAAWQDGRIDKERAKASLKLKFGDSLDCAMLIGYLDKPFATRPDPREIAECTAPSLFSELKKEWQSGKADKFRIRGYLQNLFPEFSSKIIAYLDRPFNSKSIEGTKLEGKLFVLALQHRWLAKHLADAAECHDKMEKVLIELGDFKETMPDSIRSCMRGIFEGHLGLHKLRSDKSTNDLLLAQEKSMQDLESIIHYDKIAKECQAYLKNQEVK